MLSTRLIVCSRQADQTYRVPKQNFKSRMPSNFDHKNGPYRSDVSAESSQETHIIRNSNLTDESVQQPENGPPIKFWHDRYNSEYNADDHSERLNRPRDGHHSDSTKYLPRKANDDSHRHYRENHPVKQSELEYQDSSRGKYKSNEDSNSQYYYDQRDQNMHYSHNGNINNSQGNGRLNADGKEVRYKYADNIQESGYDGPEEYNKRLSQTSEYAPDKNQKEQGHFKSDAEYHQFYPFKSSNSSSSNRHHTEHRQVHNEQLSHQSDSQPSFSKESQYSPQYNPETSSNSAYKQSGYSEEPYERPVYRDSHRYHNSPKAAKSRLPKEPHSPVHYTESNLQEKTNSNFDYHNPNSKGFSTSERGKVGDGRPHQEHDQNIGGYHYETGGHHKHFRGETPRKQFIDEESSSNDGKNLQHQENEKVAMRVVSTKKDMEPAPSETDSSLAEEHDGFLDMGAYTDKQGSFGWYADFPVGKEHDKVTYSFS